MIYKGQNQRRTVIPSVKNAQGLTVYIPEKGMRAGRKWFKAYAYYSLTAAQPYPLLFSFSSEAYITINFTSTAISITAPFTLPLLRFYQLEAAKLIKSSATLSIEAEAQSVESLSKEQMKEFEGKKSGDPIRDASLVYALGAAKFTPTRKTP
ncbi:MAG: hypothetical protein LHW64_11655 [Candidatus Cloacimonetes bacterium]|nr:hypothetical protein [Candidatus Cloacimonadota bacterium]MCB5288437.1 hypothetical protein [Candidatus Cloacimonadota bacterium]MCK9184407.1 hypothetical protein [Candidatus Cloacimonadota bacterium]MDY0230739.1 hypothetical protein [Candidatus Cloacimonadaceae bacterium]